MYKRQVLGLAFVQVLYHETLRVERTGFVFFVSIIVPIALSCTPYLQTLSRVHSRFYVFLAFIIPWMCDIGAYFVGTFLGKHKMCPKISPKKTVEGLVGGIVISVAASVLAAWLYQVLHLTPNQLGTCLLYTSQRPVRAADYGAEQRGELRRFSGKRLFLRQKTLRPY